MSDTSQNNKRIAKNTVMLYIRQLITLFIGLYTSRVVLNVLGASDYGIYNVVGGFVGMLAFLNNILSTSAQRFFSFNIGEGNIKRLKKVFSNILIVHLAMIAVLFVIAETVGLWFINEKLNIPNGRETAALIVYQFSILTLLASILQIPFMASLIAHEKMSIYAYMSIYDAVAKLMVIFFLKISSVDNLILYSALMLAVQMTSAITYNVYCRRKYEECRFKIDYDKEIIKEVTSFSSWTVMSCMASTGNVQSVNILLNMFCGTVVNAARGIAIQVNNMVMGFVRNFQVASNPQIVKLYAEGAYNDMKRLTFNSSRLSAYLLIVMIVPLFINIDFILSIWLGEYPKHTSSFLRIIQIQSIIQSMSGPIVTVVFATGCLKYPNLFNSFCNILSIVLAYILLKMGLSPEWVLVASILPWVFEGYIDSYYAAKYSHFSQYEFYKDVYAKVFLVLFAAAAFPMLMHYLYTGNEITGFVLNCVVCVISSCLSILYIGMNRDMRQKILISLISKIKK